MKKKYDEMFKAGNKAQLEQMIKNEHKEGWDDIDILFALMKISEHIPEAKQCWFKNPEQWGLLRKYASDMSNLSHMIILKCDKKLKELSK